MPREWLPESVRTSPGQALKLSAWAGVAVVVSFLSRMWLQSPANGSAVLRTVVALAPLIPSWLWARSLARWMRQLDELQRLIQFEAWLFAAVGTVFTVTALSLLASAHIPGLARVQHGLGWEGAFAVMFLLYGIGCAVSHRRYQ